MIHTILVTDDNALDNAILRNSLYQERYNLLSVLNGREALDMVEKRNIDLILLDMVMPVMDGFEFLEHFSQSPHYKNIPVIVTTSLDKAETMERLLNQYDLFDYVIKPLDPINRLILVNKIRMAIRYRDLLKQVNA